MNIERKIVKEVANELGIDKRVVDLVRKYQMRFVSRTIGSLTDERPIRLPFFGAFVLKATRNKSVTLNRTDLEKEGFMMTKSTEDSAYYSTLNTEDEYSNQFWYEIELDNESRELTLTKWTEIGAPDKLPSVNGELLYEGLVKNAYELRDLLIKFDIKCDI